MNVSVRRFLATSSVALALASCSGSGSSSPDLSSSDLSQQGGPDDLLGADLSGGPKDLSSAELFFFAVMPGEAPTQGGIAITASGSGFVDGAGLGLRFGGVAATNVKWVSDSRISATLPAHPGTLGKVDVILKNGDGQMATQPQLFYYYPNLASFGAQTATAADTGVRSVVSGDFNKDGKADIAVADGDAGNVTVLLGNGLGGFQAPKKYTVGKYPFAIAAGDLNGDGVPDLVTANQQSNNVSVLLGNGDGTYQNAQAYPVGTGPQAVSIADLNGDGQRDLVVANYFGGTVSVLLNQGTGTFGGATPVDPKGKPYSLTLAKIRDANFDLVTFNSDAGTASVLYGDGKGGFGPVMSYKVGLSPFSGVVVDLDRDGYPELVVANPTANTLTILPGLTDHTFDAANPVVVNVGTRPEFVTADDIDGDHNPDLVVANLNSKNVIVLPGKGDLTFRTPLSLVTGNKPNGVALADLDGDGKKDLVVSNFGDGQVSVLLNTSQ